MTAETYASLVLANLQDLFGPVALINPRINLVCVYSEIENLFSNLLPDGLLCKFARSSPDRVTVHAGNGAAAAAIRMLGLEEAIHQAACDCNCCDAIMDLRELAHDARRHDGPSVNVDTLNAAIEDAARFVGLIQSLSYTLHCACGTEVEYRFRDTLSLLPPIEFRLTCSACGKDARWFIPNPRQP